MPDDRENRDLWAEQAVLTFSTWAWLLAHGTGVTEVCNFVLLLMVLWENVYLFNCRSERISAFGLPLKRNRLLIGGVAAAQCVHILALQRPFMQRILGVACILLTVMEIFKYVQVRFKAD